MVRPEPVEVFPGRTGPAQAAPLPGRLQEPAGVVTHGNRWLCGSGRSPPLHKPAADTTGEYREA